MKDEYKFHIEEDFSIHLLAKGIEEILLKNEMVNQMDNPSDNKYIICATNIRGRGSKVFHTISGTSCSLSILLDVEDHILRVYFSDMAYQDKGLAYLISIGVPIFFFSASYGVIRQSLLEEEIISYINGVLKEEGVNLSNMTIKQRIICATPIISLIIFLSMGFIWKMWGWGSLAFLLIPLMPILLGEINPEYIFPFVISGIYIGLGFGLNLWHPAWIIFLTIPVYYILFPVKNKKPIKKQYIY
jgi:hypothetical protein